MNNAVGTANNFCGCGNDSFMLILILLLCTSNGAMSGCGNDSFMLILFLLLLTPNFNTSGC